MAPRGLLTSVGLVLLFCISCGDEGGSDGDENTPQTTGTDDGGLGSGDTGQQTDRDIIGAPSGDSDTNGQIDGGLGGDTEIIAGSDVSEEMASEAATVDALTACTDFQVASWDRIRECGSPTAEILPPNELAGTVCAELCESEGVFITQSAYNTCLAYGTTVPCESIDINLEEGSQIPDACPFLRDPLSCQF